MSMKDLKLTRRALIAGGTASAAVAYGVIANNLDRALFLQSAAPSYDIPVNAKNLGRVARLFGTRSQEVKLHSGMSHYKYKNGKQHPDDKWASDTIFAHAAAIASQVEYTPHAIPGSVEGGFICTGSPVSNFWSRKFLEYEYIDPQKPELGLRRIENPKFRLPFEYELDAMVISAATKEREHVSQYGKPGPNWSIHVLGEFVHPSILSSSKDFLVISRLPNHLEEPNGQENSQSNVVTIFGGAHGPGTSAIRFVLQNETILKTLEEKSSKYEYWQALITIDEVNHAGWHPTRDVPAAKIATGISDEIFVEPIHLV